MTDEATRVPPPPSSGHRVLDDFHPLVRDWFRERFGAPTDTQHLAWPRIRAGEHLLITAPTGSGKTLTAFLHVLNRFLTGDLATGATRVLYISPLKALNNDMARNLTEPLAELQRRFTEAGLELPSVRVATRSGDTKPGERQRLLRRPPEILITTPESLNLLLTSAGGRSLLHALDTVILDEIHAVLESKRGAHLITAVERLVRLSGEFQRLALSAGVRPLRLVADFVGGYRLADGRRLPRKVGIIESGAEKLYELTVARVPHRRQEEPDTSPREQLAARLLPRIRANRSTLIFANTRAMTEQLTLSLNRQAGETLAWAHHGSLAREVRQEVEQRLKAGRLKALVSTSSLEMGIDIGSLDEVILVQSPNSVSSALQRVGRAGHQVGAVSRGSFYPLDIPDLLQSAVLVRGIREKDLEPVRPVRQPLDLLAQVLVSMLAQEARTPEELHLELSCAWPFQDLPWEQFEQVLEMLTGRHASSRVRELSARLSIDRLDNRVRALAGAVRALYLSGGTIPDRGYYQLRLADSNARIGELDEEFVWEARVGQSFTFGARQWRITGITHNDVQVRPFAGRGAAPPFWIAESMSRGFHFSERLAELLETAETRLAAGDEDGLQRLLRESCRLDAEAAQAANAFLAEQRNHTRTPLPHRRQLVVEAVASGLGGRDGNQLVLHNFWGGRVNRPFALALQAAWQNRFGEQLEIFPTNDCLVLQLPGEVPPTMPLELVTPENLLELLRQRLEGSSFFGARFRENAGRALLLGKHRFNERKPLWMSRLQAQKLAESTRQLENFPILLETWRSCLQDEFELSQLGRLLQEVRSGALRVATAATFAPSPLAKAVAWEQIQKYMYADDAPQANLRTSLGSRVLAELAQQEAARPRLGGELLRQFLLRRQRLARDYAPRSASELIDWVKERVALPLAEWHSLLQALGDDAAELLAESRLHLLSWRGLIVATERLPEAALAFTASAAEPRLLRPVAEEADEAGWRARLLELLAKLPAEQGTPDESLERLLGDWLAFYGPLSRDAIQARLPSAPGRLAAGLQRLLAAGRLLEGRLLEEEEGRVFCDVACYESLLRLARRLRTPEVEPLPLSALPNLARSLYHHREEDRVALLALELERLQGHAAPASTWERELLPARCPDYEPAHLDRLLGEADNCWVGVGREKLAFARFEDLDLLPREAPEDGTETPPPAEPNERTAFGRPKNPAQLWRRVWRGELHTDSFAPVRAGIENGFKSLQAKTAGSGRSSWRGPAGHRPAVPRQRGLALGGNWREVPWPARSPDDLLAAEELKRDRARLLLRRYGIVFRELLKREPPGLGWADIFRALRYLEFAGEVVSGLFYEGVDGLQFALPEAASLLHPGRRPEEVFWLPATDPLSPCGISSRLNRDFQLPRRVAGNYLIFRGDRLLATVEAHGSRVRFFIAPDDPQLPACLCVHRLLLERRIAPKTRIELLTINRRPAAESPWLAAFEAAFSVYFDHRGVCNLGRRNQAQEKQEKEA